MKKALFFALCMGVASFVGCDDEGDFCVFDNDCKSGLCYESFCRAKNLKEGEICTGDVQCESEYCDSEIKKCKAKPAEPQKCVNDSDCASNYCLSGGYCGTYDE